jgi:transposase
MRWSKKIEPKPIRERPSIKIDMEALKKDVELYPDAYLIERAKRLNVSRNGIWCALKRLKVSYKKNSTTPKGGSRKKIYILPKH